MCIIIGATTITNSHNDFSVFSFRVFYPNIIISIAISKCSREDEEIIEDIQELCHRKPDYWTLILAKNKKDPIN